MFKWIKDAKRVPQLEDQLSMTKLDVVHANKTAAVALKEADDARNELAKRDDEIDKLKRELRKQNDADLLLVSMQIVQRITAGEKKDTSPQLRALYDQQSALQNSPYASYASQLGGYGALGGLGLWAAASPFRQ